MCWYSACNATDNDADAENAREKQRLRGREREREEKDEYDMIRDLLSFIKLHGFCLLGISSCSSCDAGEDFSH